MFKNILKIIFIFIIGMAGGIFGARIFGIYSPEWFLSSQFRSLQSSLIRPKEEKKIVIQENTALKQAVEKVQKAVAGIKTKTKTGKVISGSGIIVTSDGLVVTLADLVPQGGDSVFFIAGRKILKYQILKRDLKNNLALVKVEGNNLQTCGFADYNKLKLGERVFLVGFFLNKSNFFNLVNEGIVKYFTKDYIQTNILEKNTLNGSPLFNIKGEFLGLNTIDKKGMVFSIPVGKIRDFVGL